MSRYSALFGLFAVSATLVAQTFTGNITGMVTDPSNAAVPQAGITLTNTSTGETRSAKAETGGRFIFSQLLPSVYSLKVSHPGFKESVRSGITLNTNQTIEVNLQLTVGAISEAVQVSAQAEMLDTQTANQSMMLTTQAMRELPLNMRNPLALVHSSAGIVAARTGVSQSTDDQNHNRFAMNGGRHESVAVLVDGIPMAAGDWGGLIASPGVDAVQEVQVIRNTYEAQFGKTGGGVINMTTRGGTQTYHGSLFDFYRNDNLDANTFFNNRAGRALSEFKRNQFGGTVGGPILKAKRVYGFFGYEGLRTGNPASRQATVPTAEQRTGDFSQTLNPDGKLSIIYDPLTTLPNPAVANKFIRTAFPGNKVPSSRFDPVALNMLKLFSEPNQPGDRITGVQNWYSTGSSKTVNDRYDSRIDWSRSASHTLFGRFTIAKLRGDPAMLFQPAAETSSFARNPRYHVSIGNTFILSPTLVVNAQVGGGRWSEINFGAGRGFDLTTLGLPREVAAASDTDEPPTIGVGDYSGLGYSRYLNGVRNLLNAQVNVTKERGAHSIKFGWSIEKSQLNFTDANAPDFSFSRFGTGGPDPDSRVANSGNGLASFLLGFGSGGSLARRVRPASTDTYHGLYVQDSWRVSRRLTFTYGIRYEIQQARTERYDRYARLDFDIASPAAQFAKLPDLKGGLVYMDANNRGQWDTPYNNFAPRGGLSYKVTERLVARAGYGIFFARSNYASPISGTDGYSQTTSWLTSVDSGRTPMYYLRNPFAEGIRSPVGSGDGAMTNVGFGASGYQKVRPTPYIQQYSLDLQYEIRGNLLLELGYIGNQGRKLSFGYGVQANQLPDKYLSLGPALLEQVTNPFYGLVSSGTFAQKTVERGQLLRPYPQFTGVSITHMPGASSSYNAGAIRITKRFSKGTLINASYQFSKSIDNASENGSPGLVDGARNFNNLSLERSISSHDIPHSFALAFVQELPFGRGKKLGTSWPKALDLVAGGWQLSGIYRLASGLPNRFTATNNTFSYGGNQVPNVTNVPDAKVDNPTIDRWFNTQAFSLPAPYTFGNVPRWFPNIRFSRANNLDLSLSKNFKLTEKLKAQLRGEFFNAANHFQFGWADTSLNSRTFGQVSGGAPGAGPRNVQLGLRLDF